MLQQGKLSLQNKILCVSFGIFLILYYLVNAGQSDKATHKQQEPQSADTFIPAGHVLVPMTEDLAEGELGLTHAARACSGSPLLASHFGIPRRDFACVNL